MAVYGRIVGGGVGEGYGLGYEEVRKSYEEPNWLEGSPESADNIDRIEKYIAESAKDEYIAKQLDKIEDGVMKDAKKNDWSYGKMMREYTNRAMDVKTRKGDKAFEFLSHVAIGSAMESEFATREDDYQNKKITIGHKISGLTEEDMSDALLTDYINTIRLNKQVTPSSLERRLKDLPQDDKSELWKVYASRDKDAFNEYGVSKMTMKEISETLNDDDRQRLRSALSREDHDKFNRKVDEPIAATNKETLKYIMLAQRMQSTPKEVENIQEDAETISTDYVSPYMANEGVTLDEAKPRIIKKGTQINVRGAGGAYAVYYTRKLGLSDETLKELKKVKTVEEFYDKVNSDEYSKERVEGFTKDFDKLNLPPIR